MNQERRIAFLLRENERLAAENKSLHEEVKALNIENSGLHKISESVQNVIEEMQQRHDDVLKQYENAADEARKQKETYERMTADARLHIREYEKKFEKLMKQINTAI